MRLFRKQNFAILITDVIVWVLAMVIFVILRFYPTYDPFEATQALDYFELMIWLGVQAGLILGVVYGVVDVLLDQRWLRKRSFGSILMIKGCIHLMVILAVSIIVRVEAFDKMEIEFTREMMRTSIVNPGFLIIILYTTMVSFVLNFGRQINLKFGPGNLAKFLTGKFHHPKEELRIFMFLDMKASTTIAENLGHVKFGELVQDCFSDLTVVVNCQAEVYQYVGDEAILYWEVKKGLHHCNCLMAFFDYMKQLKSRESYYLKKYGVCPDFKAGINIGEVTVAEVGDIKRDLAFLGDTMNTAARIEGQCNIYNKNLLISEALHDQLPECQFLKRTFVASLELEGKQQSIGIFSVELLS
jgi:adenylate cyclase